MPLTQTVLKVKSPEFPTLTPHQTPQVSEGNNQYKLFVFDNLLSINGKCVHQSIVISTPFFQYHSSRSLFPNNVLGPKDDNVQPNQSPVGDASVPPPATDDDGDEQRETGENVDEQEKEATPAKTVSLIILYLEKIQ